MLKDEKRTGVRASVLICALLVPLMFAGCPGPGGGAINLNQGGNQAQANGGGGTNAGGGATTASTTKTCKGVVRKIVRGGRTTFEKGTCTGDCADGTKCQWLKSTDQHGSTREWCACGNNEKPVEPADECYLVFYTPGPGVGGGPSEVICPPKDCPNGQKCQPQEELRGESGDSSVFEVTCGCK